MANRRRCHAKILGRVGNVGLIFRVVDKLPFEESHLAAAQEFVPSCSHGFPHLAQGCKGGRF